MKKLFLLTGLLMASLIASAQQVVSGTVTDKDGNPIPGAKVEIVGSTESCITELDGTYSIETTNNKAKRVKVQYAGMQTKVEKIKPGMIVKLSTSNWWSAKPDKYRWLVSLQGAFPEEDASNPSLGLMLGRVKNIGWYIKGVYSPTQSTDYDAHDWNWSEYNNRWFTGKDNHSYWAATGGLIVRLGCPIHLYAGAGYSERVVAWEMADGKYAERHHFGGEVALDYGLMMRFDRWVINGGVLMDTDNMKHCIGNFGIGYCF